MRCIVLFFDIILSETPQPAGRRFFTMAKIIKMPIKNIKTFLTSQKKSKIKIGDKDDNAFIGEFGKPKESVRFTSSSLKLNSNNMIYRNFFAELELTNTFDGWQVQLNLVNKNMN